MTRVEGTMATGLSTTAAVDHAFINRLCRPKANLERLAQEVERTPDLLGSVIAAIASDHTCTRFAAIKLLRIVSEKTPQLVYPHFAFVAKMLTDENSILKWNAILTLANLATVDREEKLDRIIDDYLKPIRGPAMIDAANTMGGAAVIARAKPYLASKIATGILTVENASYATPECRNVAIGHAITALNQFFTGIEDKSAVRSFIHQQQKNSRPATSKKAEKFCKKWLAAS
jgi:hypothetical protein